MGLNDLDLFNNCSVQEYLRVAIIINVIVVAPVINVKYIFNSPLVITSVSQHLLYLPVYVFNNTELTSCKKTK